MRRDPFDQVCECSFETATHECICSRRKEPAKERCLWCATGRHKLHRKGEPFTTEECLSALTGRSKEPMY